MPCSDCKDKTVKLEAIQLDRAKWDRKAIVLISDAITAVHPADAALADQLMKLVADLNRIGLAEKEARKS